MEKFIKILTITFLVLTIWCTYELAQNWAYYHKYNMTMSYTRVLIYCYFITLSFSGFVTFLIMWMYDFQSKVSNPPAKSNGYI